MNSARSGRVLMALVLSTAVAGLAPALAAGPELTATFTVADAKPSGDAVQMTFSFSLRSSQPSDLAVEAIKLGNPSASDRPYATFPGGTIPAGGEMTGSASISVPKSAYKKWKEGEPASLFVRTSGEGGSTVWTRVDATATGPIH